MSDSIFNVVYTNEWLNEWHRVFCNYIMYVKSRHWLTWMSVCVSCLIIWTSTTEWVSSSCIWVFPEVKDPIPLHSHEWVSVFHAWSYEWVPLNECLALVYGCFQRWRIQSHCTALVSVRSWQKLTWWRISLMSPWPLMRTGSHWCLLCQGRTSVLWVKGLPCMVQPEATGGNVTLHHWWLTCLALYLRRRWRTPRPTCGITAITNWNR